MNIQTVKADLVKAEKCISDLEDIFKELHEGQWSITNPVDMANFIKLIKSAYEPLKFNVRKALQEIK